ncbi:hypothetical protein TREES_T100017650 [Tupaia chinensis]|uniref:Uncharacterized protein n=1 Tax=Tupaia chinensis TaxID=246437 RepID=L9L4W8_TUPCH|nr:hypothetical protein TREES_T100017650 [Tupaia chinensis]
MEKVMMVSVVVMLVMEVMVVVGTVMIVMEKVMMVSVVVMLMMEVMVVVGTVVIVMEKGMMVSVVGLFVLTAALRPSTQSPGPKRGPLHRTAGTAHGGQLYPQRQLRLLGPPGPAAGLAAVHVSIDAIARDTVTRPWIPLLLGAWPSPGELLCPGPTTWSSHPEAGSSDGQAQMWPLPFITSWTPTLVASSWREANATSSLSGEKQTNETKPRGVCEEHGQPGSAALTGRRGVTLPSGLSTTVSSGGLETTSSPHIVLAGYLCNGTACPGCCAEAHEAPESPTEDCEAEALHKFGNPS